MPACSLALSKASHDACLTKFNATVERLALAKA